MAVLGVLEIFGIVIAGIFVVILCCGCCCLVNNPLCCAGAGLLAALGLRGRKQRTGYVSTTAVIIPPPRTQSQPVSRYTEARAVPATAPPGPPMATAIPYDDDRDAVHVKGLGKVTSSSGFGGGGPLPSAPPDQVGQLTLASQQSWHDATAQDIPGPAQKAFYRDSWALVLFFVNVAVLSTLAIRLGLPALGLWERQLQDQSLPTLSPETVSAARTLLLTCAGLMLIGDLIALVWLHVMLHWSTALIHGVIWSTIIGSTALAVGGVMLGNMWIFLFFAVVTMLAVCLLYQERRRVALSSANLGLACKALLNNKGVIGIAYLILFVQLVWALLWLLAAVGVYSLHQADHHKGGRGWGLTIYLIISLYWGQQVNENVLRCTVVGVMASWWYTPEITAPVAHAFYRAIGPSFGSICIGSFLVALIEGARAGVSALMRFRYLTCCFGFIFDALLFCIDFVWRMFNRWAFVYVGIWGYNFSQAGYLALGLFSARGWQVVLNDYLIYNVLLLGSILVGGITSGVGVLVCEAYPEAFYPLHSPQYFAGVAGFLLGFAGCLVLMNLLNAAVDTIFVCWASDPRILQDKHPREYMELVCVWRDFERDHAREIYGDDGERARINVIRVQI